MVSLQQDTSETSSGPNQDIATSRIASIFRSFLISIPLDQQEEIMKTHSQSMSFLDEIESSMDKIISLIPQNQVTDPEAETEDDDEFDDETDEERSK